MIGPSSSTNNMPNRQDNEIAVRAKRRVFDDLDIDNFCEEICQSPKKHHTMERDSLEVAMAQIVHTSQFPLVASIQESNNPGSVARLEVLVVDGTWDVSNIEHNDLPLDLPSTDSHESDIQNSLIVRNVENIENNYNAILSYWDPTEEAENDQNIVDNQNVSPPTVMTTINNNHNDNNNNNNINNSSQVDDQEDGNLSWLLDFKLDSLIEAPEEKISVPCFKNRNRSYASSDNSNLYLNSVRGNDTTDLNNSESTINQRDKQSVEGYANNIRFSSNCNGLKKPPFTYTELIEHALQERGELTVSAIYQWISEHFPYYKSNDDRWKNSVRHNLSINPHFRKGSKAPHGAGHLWAIANRNDSRPRQLLNINSGISGQRQIIKTFSENNYPRKNIKNTPVIDEVAAATASISQMNDDNELTSSVTLEHSAEQILNGVKKEVEVQYLMPIMTVQQQNDREANEHNVQQKITITTNKETDFLNPVSKEIVAEECGLIGENYLVTDINSSTLGLNVVEPEIITPDHLFGEELSFQFYELASPSQLQSA
ncbi:putative uncharacterized protein DDB_G0282499 [Chelonus insularis]|uniref:putative uncharacterized protein DDB_G0282499 n=1 Tax=Chelonus insularis TaxID=460826 RepID=UPI00158EE6D5|nr:putative uncharacterized protein DDB_G0282499 [Chelonus insularis]